MRERKGACSKRHKSPYFGHRQVDLAGKVTLKVVAGPCCRSKAVCKKRGIVKRNQSGLRLDRATALGILFLQPLRCLSSARWNHTHQVKETKKQSLSSLLVCLTHTQTRARTHTHTHTHLIPSLPPLSFKVLYILYQLLNGITLKFLKFYVKSLILNSRAIILVIWSRHNCW